MGNKIQLLQLSRFSLFMQVLKTNMSSIFPSNSSWTNVLYETAYTQNIHKSSICRPIPFKRQAPKSVFVYLANNVLMPKHSTL